MKTKEEVQKECFGVVYDTDDFVRIVNSGNINDFDGIGVFHDGENETNIDVFSDMRYPDSKKKNTRMYVGTTNNMKEEQ